MAVHGAAGLRKFSAQISYTANSGYGSVAGFKGDGKLSKPQDALFCALHELANIAEIAGWGDLAIDAVTTRIRDVRAATSRAPQAEGGAS